MSPEKKLRIAMKEVSRCLNAVNKKNSRPHYNGNRAKHNFLNEIAELVDRVPFEKGSREERMNLATLVIHHLEYIWNVPGNWEVGANEVWEIIRTREYPRSS